MGLDRLLTTELRACDEALVDHRVHVHMGLKQPSGVLIHTGDQAQKSGLARTVVADQGHTLTLMHSAAHVLQGRDHRTATTAVELPSCHRAEQGGLETARFRCGHWDIEAHVLQLQGNGWLDRGLNLGLGGENVLRHRRQTTANPRR